MGPEVGMAAGEKLAQDLEVGMVGTREQCRWGGMKVWDKGGMEVGTKAGIQERRKQGGMMVQDRAGALRALGLSGQPWRQTGCASRAPGRRQSHELRLTAGLGLASHLCCCQARPVGHNAHLRAHAPQTLWIVVSVRGLARVCMCTSVCAHLHECMFVEVCFCIWAQRLHPQAQSSMRAS